MRSGYHEKIRCISNINLKLLLNQISLPTNPDITSKLELKVCTDRNNVNSSLIANNFYISKSPIVIVDSLRNIHKCFDEITSRIRSTTELPHQRTMAPID